jgi:hypothetical protein
LSLLGRQVRLIVKDDASDQNTVVADYNWFISQGKVDLLLATFSSLLNIPAAAVPERNRMVIDVVSLLLGGWRRCWPSAGFACCHREPAAGRGLGADRRCRLRTGVGCRARRTASLPGRGRWALLRGAPLASRYPKMAARRERRGVLAVKTSGRSSAILDSKDRNSPNIGPG